MKYLLLIVLLFSLSAHATIDLALRCPESDFSVCKAEPVSSAIALTAAHCLFFVELMKEARPECGFQIWDGQKFLNVESAETHPEFSFEGNIHDIGQISIVGQFREYTAYVSGGGEYELSEEAIKGQSGKGHFLNGKLIGILSRKRNSASVYTRIEWPF